MNIPAMLLTEIFHSSFQANVERVLLITMLPLPSLLQSIIQKFRNLSLYILSYKQNGYK